MPAEVFGDRQAEAAVQMFVADELAGVDDTLVVQTDRGEVVVHTLVQLAELIASGVHIRKAQCSHEGRKHVSEKEPSGFEALLDGLALPRAVATDADGVPMLDLFDNRVTGLLPDGNLSATWRALVAAERALKVATDGAD